MFNKNSKTAFLVVLIAFSSVIGIAGMASAAGGDYYVGTSGTNDAVTYSTIQDAVNAAGENATIHVAPGTYNTSVNVETTNLTIANYNVTNGDGTGASVEINATNEPYGEVFYGIESNTVNLGTNVSIGENAAYVGTGSAPAGASLYSDIPSAIGGVSNNTVLYIAPGTYSNVSYNITKENVSFVNYNTSQNLTIDSTNTTEGSAFHGEFADSVRVGPDVTIKGEVYAGGGGSIGDSLKGEIFGIPIWAIAIVIVLGGYLAYEQEE